MFVKGSELHQLVRIAGDISADDSNLHGLNELIQKRISRDCAFYTRSVNVLDTITCGSGEYDGKPFVLGGCTLCLVSQFSKSGQFLGDLGQSLDIIQGS